MTPNVLFAGRADRWDDYQRELARACAEREIVANISPEHPPEDVDYIIFAPNGPISNFAEFPNLKAVFSLWAGVERIVGNPTLTVPLTRMVDTGLSHGMREWVSGHVLRYHLGIDVDIRRTDTEWKAHVPPLARERTVGILGLGTLGKACAQALSVYEFNILGCSRTEKTIDGVKTYTGEAGLNTVLQRSDILVLLLPDTTATNDVLNAQTLATMPRGARIINPGRGTLIDDAALLQALDDGQIGHATLDVFRVEPLPTDHPYWTHPNVTITPHIAAETRANSASDIIAENLHRAIKGDPLLYLVDRNSGY